VTEDPEAEPEAEADEPEPLSTGVAEGAATMETGPLTIWAAAAPAKERPKIIDFIVKRVGCEVLE